MTSSRVARSGEPHRLAAFQRDVVVEKDPRYPRARSGLIERHCEDELVAFLAGAATLSRAGNSVAAITVLLSAVRLAPDDLTAHRRLAATYAIAGDHDSARGEYDRFIARLEARGYLDAAAVERSYASALLAPRAIGRLATASPAARRLTTNHSFAVLRVGVAIIALGAMFAAGSQIFADGANAGRATTTNVGGRSGNALNGRSAPAFPLMTAMSAVTGPPTPGATSTAPASTPAGTSTTAGSPTLVATAPSPTATAVRLATSPGPSTPSPSRTANATSMPSLSSAPIARPSATPTPAPTAAPPTPAPTAAPAPTTAPTAAPAPTPTPTPAPAPTPAPTAAPTPTPTPATSPAPSSCATTGANVVSYEADPTGTNDSTSAINAAKTAAGVGGSIYFPSGIYRLTVLNPLAGQTINAPAAHLLGPIEIYNSNVTVCGAEIGPVAQYGVYFSGVSFTHLMNLNVHNTGNIAIFGANGVTDTLIENSTVTSAGLSGITIHANVAPLGARNRILNNTVSGSAQINIEIWAPTSTVTGNTTYDGTMGLSIGAAAGSDVGSNHVNHARDYGIELGAGSGSTVHDNNVDQTSGPPDGGVGIIIDRGEHSSSILRNLVTNSAQRAIQFTLGSHDNLADLNTETGYGIAGIETHTVDNNIITHNTGSVRSF